LVNAEPKIRFFAGTSLVAPDGANLGTLCVVDHKPRTLTETQREALKTVSRQVIAQLELRRQITSMVKDSKPSDASAAALSRDVISPFYKGGEKVKVDGRSTMVFRAVEQTRTCLPET
jgi:hypothetical protein